jgi:hypothetical protein
MTLKIEVFVPEDDVRGGGAAKYLASALTAIGYNRQTYPPIVQDGGRAIGKSPDLAAPYPSGAVSYADPTSAIKAAFAESPVAEKPKSTRSSKKADAPKAAISPGEERIAPEDEATQAADAADEAAEVKPTGKLTHDDVRQAVARYSKKHGLPAATRDIPLILDCGVADLPDDQQALANAVQDIDNWTLTDSGYSRAEQEPTENAFDDGPAEPTIWTKADVKAAMMAYGEKFDKTSDPNAMAFTKVDVSKIFSKLFGEGVKAFSQVPDDSESCGRAVDAINRAIADDPFQRG